MPTKIVSRVCVLTPQCEVSLIDAFEGVSDGASIKKILSQVAPRKLVGNACVHTSV